MEGIYMQIKKEDRIPELERAYFFEKHILKPICKPLSLIEHYCNGNDEGIPNTDSIIWEKIWGTLYKISCNFGMGDN